MNPTPPTTESILVASPQRRNRADPTPPRRASTPGSITPEAARPPAAGALEANPGFSRQLAFGAYLRDSIGEVGRIEML
jgi:hypothetical protein